MPRRLALGLCLLASLFLLPMTGRAQSPGLDVVRIKSKPDLIRAFLRPEDKAVRRWASKSLATGTVTVGLKPGGQARVKSARLASKAGEGVSTVLVVDFSGSVKSVARRKIQAALKHFVDGMGSNDETAIVVFYDLQETCEFTNDKRKLKDFIDNATAGGKHTHLWAALHKAHDLAIKKAPHDFVRVMVFSDGEDETVDGADAVARQYQASRLPIYAYVQWNPRAKAEQQAMRDRFVRLAAETHGTAEPIRDLDDLRNSFSNVRTDYDGMLIVDFDACGVPTEATELTVDFILGSAGKQVAYTQGVSVARHSLYGHIPCRCAGDADCASPTPKCDVATGKCKGCLSDGDCDGGQGLRCDLTSFLCKQGVDPWKALCDAIAQAQVSSLACKVVAASGGRVLSDPWSQGSAEFCANRSFERLSLSSTYKGGAKLVCEMQDSNGKVLANTDTKFTVGDGVARTVHAQWKLGGTQVTTPITAGPPSTTCKPKCESWQRCKKGKCGNLSCKADKDCGKAGRCSAGVCGPLVPCPAPCESWQHCKAGKCEAVACKADVDCGKDGRCEGGACTAAQPCEPVCGDCERCAKGVCQPRKCKGDGDCREGCVCDTKAGVCREDKNLLLIYGAIAGGVLLLSLLIILLVRGRGKKEDEPPPEPDPVTTPDPDPVPPPEPVNSEDDANVNPPPVDPVVPVWHDPRETSLEEDGPVANTPFSLVVTGGRLQLGQRFILREETLVGADPSWANLLLNAPAVSSRHAKVEVYPSGNVWVQDVGSSNGTRVRDIKLLADQREEVRPGDTIFFSNDVQVRLEGPPGQQPAADGPAPFEKEPEPQPRRNRRKDRTIID